MKSEAGFTLLETLIVLSVVIVIISITAIQFNHYPNLIKKQHFINQLAKDIYFAQLYAMTSEQYVYVNIIPEQNRYNMRANMERILDKTYDENILINKGTLDLNFRFGPSGNINKFGTFHVKIDDHHYRFVFQIGKGRFYIEQK